MESKIAATYDQSNQDGNPCIRNCCLDEKKVCLGCGRSLPEILEWHHADPSRQRQISSVAEQRLTERSSM